MIRFRYLIFVVLLLSGRIILSQGSGQIMQIQFDSEQKIESAYQIRLLPSAISIADNHDRAHALLLPFKVSMDTAVPFLAFSFSSQGYGFDNGLVTFYCRSQDQNKWNDWQPVHHAHETSPAPDRFVSELLFFDPVIRNIQLKIVLQKGNQDVPLVENVRVNLFQPFASTANNRPEKEEEYSNLDCYCPLPVFMTRTEWGCPDGQQPSCDPPSYTEVTHLVIHHSATSNSSQNWPAVVLSFWDYHVNTHGWCDIGYNWLVDPEGQLYQGRGGGDNVKGAHFSCVNSNTLGVCVIGNFMNEGPTIAAKEKLAKLISWKCCLDDLEPLGLVYHEPSQLELPVICGHRDVNNSPAPEACPSGTACPGDIFYNQLDEIKILVNAWMELENCGEPTPPENDDCENAIVLNYHPECEYIASHVEGATPSGLEQPACSPYPDFPAMEDVWFTFEATSESHGIVVDPSNYLDPVLVLYDGCIGQELACADYGGGGGQMEFIDYDGFEIGASYYVRVYHYGSRSPLSHNFDICLTDPIGLPIALFDASTQEGPAPLIVNFFDLSLNEPQAWEWYFEGGDPSFSNDPNPEGIIYDDEGIFTVSLTVSNSLGQHQLCREGFIQVNPTGIRTLTKDQIRVEPNPFDQQIRVFGEFDAHTTVDLKVCDLAGRLLFDNPLVNVTSQYIEIDLTNLSMGPYLLTIDDGNNVYRTLMMKK